MLEPLCPSLTFEQCVHALADTLKADVQPQSHDDRLLLVHYFAALVIGGRLPAGTHDGMGNTALHYAARVGWAAGVSSIISSGALSDGKVCGDGEGNSDHWQRHAAAAVLRANDSGCSALHCASVSGCLRTLHALLQVAGNAMNDDGDNDDDYNEYSSRKGTGRMHSHIDNERRTLLHYAGIAPPPTTTITVELDYTPPTCIRSAFPRTAIGVSCCSQNHELAGREAGGGGEGGAASGADEAAVSGGHNGDSACSDITSCFGKLTGVHLQAARHSPLLHWHHTRPATLQQQQQQQRQRRQRLRKPGRGKAGQGHRKHA